MPTESNTYDVVIIGSGISGLVCGCSLAKSGMKVLIAEQHDKPGGYCTSFQRAGYTFDAAAHSFGGYRKGGMVRKVLDEFGIEKKIKITRYDPSDVIVTPDFAVSFWSDINKTIKGFQEAFPSERAQLESFFSFLMKPDPNSFAGIRNWTFQNLLDRYFRNEKLKSVLAYPLFGNGALPPSRMSALIGAKIFQEFLLDGGYYPGSSMQTLTDALAERFKEFGGELRLSYPITRIEVKDGNVTGVISDRDGLIQSKLVISGCDAQQTFLTLLGREAIPNQDFLHMLDTMVPSLSIFILYLGLSKSFPTMKPGTNVWFLTDFDLSRYLASQEEFDFDHACILVRAMPAHKSLLAFVNVPYHGKPYWDARKKTFMEAFIGRIERLGMPGLSGHIVYKDAATPHTLERYTRNYQGAAYGWECTPSQLGILDLRKPSFIRGLFLTGHWTTMGLGIPGVVYSAYDTAKSILRKELGGKQKMC